MKPIGAELAAGAGALRHEGWLCRCPPDFAEAVLARAQWRSFGPGKTLSHGGDTEGGIFGIAQGAVSFIPVIGAPDMPAIHIAAAPFWYGSNPLIGSTPRLSSVVARAPSLVASIPHHALALLLTEHPHWWEWIALHVTEILGLSSQIATDLLLRDSRRRLVAVLLRLGDRRRAGGAPAVADVGQDELAAMANMSRQTAGPLLHALAGDGLITPGYRTIAIHDPVALRAIVDG